jgi:hypothetical protein
MKREMRDFDIGPRNSWVAELDYARRQQALRGPGTVWDTRVREAEAALRALGHGYACDS